MRVARLRPAVVLVAVRTADQVVQVDLVDMAVGGVRVAAAGTVAMVRAEMAASQRGWLFLDR